MTLACVKLTGKKNKTIVLVCLDCVTQCVHSTQHTLSLSQRSTSKVSAASAWWLSPSASGHLGLLPAAIVHNGLWLSLSLILHCINHIQEREVLREESSTLPQ